MNFSIQCETNLDYSNFKNHQDHAQRCFTQYEEIINSDHIGFYRLVDEQKHIDLCYEVFEKFKEKKNFVHVGIGGSALGPQLLLKALARPNQGPRFEFIDNIDPDFTSRQLTGIEPKDTVYYFVSKSGKTAETLAAFCFITNQLKEAGINEQQWCNFLVFATDPKNGHLRELADQYGIETLDIPTDIGGRFSIFTPVGILPALFANIDMKKVLNGAKEIKKSIANNNVDTNPLLQSALQLYLLRKENEITQTVFMPYSSTLRELSFWFTQLWAESLGKAQSRDKKTIYTGLTPIPAYGATDQHSQVQLFMDGPRDKCLIILEVEKFENDFSLDNKFQGENFTLLNSKNLSDLMHAELYGTLKALREKKRPYIHCKIAKADEQHLGALILYFECLTALMGEFFDIDAFDQPGVEAGKRFAFEMLAKD